MAKNIYIFIYSKVITFAACEREQNWSPQTTPHQFLSEIWAIAYSEYKETSRRGGENKNCNLKFKTKKIF